MFAEKLYRAQEQLRQEQLALEPDNEKD